MPEVKLYISPNQDQPGEYLVVVDGTGFYEAENKQVSIRIKGADEWYDDKLFSIPDVGFPVPRVSGGGFNIGRSVPSNTLNEDWGQDEIYALVSIDGWGSIKTNTITGKF